MVCATIYILLFLLGLFVVYLVQMSQSKCSSWIIKQTKTVHLCSYFKIVINLTKTGEPDHE